MTPAELEAIGLALYGPAWRSRLAEVLGSDRSRVSRWAAGKRAIPKVAADRIWEMLAEERMRRRKGWMRAMPSEPSSKLSAQRIRKLAEE